MTSRRAWWCGLAVVVLLLGPAGGHAQAPADRASSRNGPAHSPLPEYGDAGAAMLHEAAMAYHARHGDGLQRYEAVVRQRLGVHVRTPLKDRLLYRAETAHRVFWSRGEPVRIQALGIREQALGRRSTGPVNVGLIDHYYDPAADRLLLGNGGGPAEGDGDGRPAAHQGNEERAPGEGGEDPPPGGGPTPGDDFEAEHPLEPGTAGGYRFSSGDTVRLALPTGAEIRAVELVMTPIRRAPTRLSGSLWIEPTTGALVRAVYRLAETVDAMRDIEDVRRENEAGDFRWIPGFFKPWTFEATLIRVDYALWEGDVWLPRTWRAEGILRLGVLAVPGAFDRAYRFDRVSTDAVADASRLEEGSPPAAPWPDVPPGYRVRRPQEETPARDVEFWIPEDTVGLGNASELPPPVWEDAPGFMRLDEAPELLARLDRTSTGRSSATPVTLRWGLQRPDLVRYNRVEGLSLGARMGFLPDVRGRPLSVVGTVRLGTADLVPNARLDLARTSLARVVTASAYHELAATDERARPFGPGNTLWALLGGRDDGDYYRRAGVRMTLRPPPQHRPSYELSVHSEYHRPAPVETRGSLVRLWRSEDWAFRPDIAAAQGWEHAASVVLSPWHGTDPTRVQAGLEVAGTAAAGDFPYAMLSLMGRMSIPLPGALRLGMTAGGGAASADVPPQRAFAVGGAQTLRAYAPRSLTGSCMARGSAEIQRVFAVAAWSAFADVAWAGPCASGQAGRPLRSMGLGLSFVDGLIRTDVARGLDGHRPWRFDLYLDAPF